MDALAATRTLRGATPAVVAGRVIAWRTLAALGAVAAGLLAGVLLASPPRLSGPSVAQRASAYAPTESLSGLRALPLGAQAVVSRTLAAGDPAFRFRSTDGARVVTAGGMRARVAGGTLALRAPGGRLVLAPETSGDQVWYAAGPLGIEQRFTVERPARSGELRISMRLGGDVVPRANGGLVSFWAGGRAVFRLGGLSARDAAGRNLPAHLVLRGGRLVIDVAARGARYPVRIDPFVEAAELKATSPEDGAGFGDAVAKSGSTIVVGAPGETVSGNGNEGAAYVFTEPKGGWSAAATATRLTEPSGAVDDHFGISVAVSGRTVIVGANAAEDGDGAAWVFTEPTNGWSGDVGTPAELTASDGASENGFGFAVATDGSTIIVGSTRDISDVDQPVVYVFYKGAGWSSQAGDTELVVANAPEGLEGRAIAISGSTVAAGAYTANSDAGAVYVFTAPTGGWPTGSTHTQTATLTAPNAAPRGELGWSVAVNGSTLAAGAPNPDYGSGDVYVWTEPAGGWAGTVATPAVLTEKDGTTGDELGAAVGVETTVRPSTVVASAPGASVDGHAAQGALDVFTEPPAGWSGAVAPTAVLTAADGAAGDELGGEVRANGALVGAAAVAIDGGTIVAGSALHASQSGAAYVFTNTTTTSTGPSPTPLTATLTKLTHKASRVADRVTCRGPSGAVCRVTERLTYKPRKKKRIVVASRTVTIRTGHIVKVQLRLNRRGRRLLAKRHRLRVRLTAMLRVNGERRTFATHSVSLRTARKPRRSDRTAA